MSELGDVDTLLEIARDADYWDFSARLGDTGITVEEPPQIEARHFNLIVRFAAPTPDRPFWVASEQRLEYGRPAEPGPRLHLTAADVIDTVPHALDDWVLQVTLEMAEFFAADAENADDESKSKRAEQIAARLRAEFEQAEAHSRRWQERAEGHYGDRVIYELRDDTEIVYERSEHDGRPALLMGHTGDLSVILVPPDSVHPWRRSEPGHVDDYGRRITVREAIDYAGPDHGDWVRKETALALGETLGELRKIQDRALSGRDPQALAELARLAGHARELAEGLQPPLA